MEEFKSVFAFMIFVASIYLIEVCLFLKNIILPRILKKKEKHVLSFPEKIFHILAGLGLLCICYSYFIEPNWIEIKTVEISSRKLKNASLRVVQISDTHSEKGDPRLKRLPGLINALNPDLIIFTGDTINDEAALEEFKDALGRLSAKIDKFAVTGNYDDFFWRKLDLFGGTGFRVMNEKSTLFEKDGDKFYVSGVSYMHHDRYYNVLKNIPNDGYSIFLYHKPDLIKSLIRMGLNVDLYLAGHTHGGQVAMPFYGALITLSKYGKQYESGKYIVGKIILYVNRGIGMEGEFAPKLRFCARPEITVFDISPLKN